MKKQTFVIGFMLFALFFGAGNLIYPPTLGLEAGTSFWSAIIGFVISGVGLPILAVVAIALVKSDPQELSNRVHPLFGLIFTSLVYLTIGPFFGIPRAASVAYEISMEPFGNASILMTLIYTVIFFALVFFVSLNPSKVVDRIGELLTPILLVTIAILIGGAYFTLNTVFTDPIEKYTTAPLLTGFVEGYLTMDAIGALAFGMVVVTAFKAEGITSRKSLITETLKAGLVTGIGLTGVYVSIGWIGAKMGGVGTYANGGEIIASAAHLIFGSFGNILLGVIVTLACLTTAIGLVVASGQYFSQITKISYKTIVLSVTIGSFIIANQGLDAIVSVSVPVLAFLYPIAIVIILLAFIHPILKNSQAVYRGTIIATALFSLYDGLANLGIKIASLDSWLVKFPLHEEGLGWIVPAIIGGIVGYVLMTLIHKNKERVR